MRTIRLKDTPPGRQEHTPTDAYRRMCDGTLGLGPFVQEGTSDGFLATGNERPQATRSLVLVGDSFVESMFASVTTRFASRVERELPPAWRVSNAGLSGMTALHLLLVLSAKMPPFLVNGGKIAIFIGQSDVSATTQPGSYWDPRRTVTPILPALEQMPMGWEPRVSMERMVDAVCGAATALGLDYVLVAAPYRDGDFNLDPVLRSLYGRDRRDYELATQNRLALREVTLEAAERYGRRAFDAQRYVEPSDFYDILHLNECGHERFAAAIAPWLRAWVSMP